ncbi:hypothetical protein GCM10007216_19620 [Thalassobacillus devorans]|uniref:Uncharacterized protein n=3 Tax=Thalassobacillus devorans TaxID=279813 RepID=A0ABQ1P1I2_9BACI|nr:hypothetical protein [Thalassobacillus devorans]NIK28093.1 putative membrane protein YdbT with pleckstrin-like domain [Thalassobacillus devorans]GGC88930.1 hypothetical protein GCM10007216_19620 [Thalassobacillus devorans]
MVRTAFSLVMSVIFLIVQSMIVMAIKGYEMIHFDNYSLLASVLAVNFFLSFSILTNIKYWINGRYENSDYPVDQ